jgi:hypothetical protein
VNDIEPFERPGSTKNLARQGVTAICMIGGGLFLFLVEALARFRVVGLVIGVLTGIVGLSALFSKNPADKKSGVLITAAGVLVILSRTGIRFLRALAPTLLIIGALGLLAMGVWKGILFFLGLKRRS